MTPIIIPGSESTTEPIGISEAAQNLGLNDDSPWAVAGGRIARLIKAARQACEEELELSLVAKTLEVAQSSFCPTRIELPQGPVRSIVSVTYVNTDGADTVLPADQYRMSVYERMAVLWPAYDASWPSARNDAESVRVRYTAGYPSTDSPPDVVPEPIRQAMHLYIAHYFVHREAANKDAPEELPLGARYLLGKYRRGLGV